MNNPELINLLRSHQDVIATAWAKKVHSLPDSHYAEYSLEDIKTWTSQWLVGIIELLATDSSQVLNDYLYDEVPTRLEAGFTIYEVTEGLLLSKEVILPIIWSSYSDNAHIAVEVITYLDTILRNIIVRFEYLFSDVMHQHLLEETRQRLIESESLQRTTTALLEKLTLDEVLEIVCYEACQLTGATAVSYTHLTLPTSDLV